MSPTDTNFGEFCESPERGTSYISGVTFQNKKVDYTVYQERAVFEGDILLGTLSQMEMIRKLQEGELDSESPYFMEGLVIAAERYRWPDSTVHYLVDATLPNPQRVSAAIQHWEQNTNLRFQVRTSEENYVRFIPGDGCGAHVGMLGGEQLIILGNSCTTGNAIHEIGHCVGLWHEHSRSDRESFIQVVWENIKPEARHNFDQHISDGNDILEYDYGSIMHYPGWAFAIDPSKPTIISPQPIGQREGLSPGDIQTINQIYPRHEVYLPIVIADDEG